MAEPVPLKYRAFISYSHADTSWAKWLHRALEGFTIDKDLVGRETATGTIPKSLKPIFRDREDFTAGHTLTDQTQAALDASAALIVICSPASAKSHYVNEEIRLFKSRHPERPVVPLIVGGKPGDPELECFPSVLKFKLDADGKITGAPVDVLAADAREEGDGKSLALAKVVAGLLGVSSDDIFRRAERERRRQGRIQSVIGLVIAGLIGAGGFLAWQSHQQQQTLAEVQALVTKYSATDTTEGAAPDAEESLTRAITAIAEGAASDPRYAKALELLKAGKPAEAEPLLKAVAEEKEKRAASENKQAAAAYENLGAITQLSDPKRARDAYTKAASLDPDNFEALYWSGRLEFEAGNLDASEQAYKRLAAFKGDEAGACATCFALVGLGDIASARGKLDEAFKYYQDSLAAAQRFSKTHNGDVESQLALGTASDRIGDVLVDQGKDSEALRYYRDNIDRAKADPTVATKPRNLWISYAKLGHTLRTSNPDEALRTLKEALALAERWSKIDPQNQEWQRELSVSYEFIGDVLMARGNWTDSLKYFQDGLAVADRLAKSDPDNRGYAHGLANLYFRDGEVLDEQGNQVEALKNFQEAMAIAESLIHADPGNADWHSDFVRSLSEVSRLRLASGDTAGALAVYAHAIELSSG